MTSGHEITDTHPRGRSIKNILVYDEGVFDERIGIDVSRYSDVIVYGPDEVAGPPEEYVYTVEAVNVIEQSKKIQGLRSQPISVRFNEADADRISFPKNGSYRAYYEPKEGTNKLVAFGGRTAEYLAKSYLRWGADKTLDTVWSAIEQILATEDYVSDTKEIFDDYDKKTVKFEYDQAKRRKFAVSWLRFRVRMKKNTKLTFDVTTDCTRLRPKESDSKKKTVYINHYENQPDETPKSLNNPFKIAHKNITLSTNNINTGPKAAFSYTPQNPETGDKVTLDGAASQDPDGTIKKYDWSISRESFGEVWSDTGETMTFSTNTPGNYKTSLKVTDNEGKSNSMRRVITVKETSGGGSGGDGGGDGINTGPKAAFSYTPQNPEAGDKVTFDGAASQDPDGTIKKYDWSISRGSFGEVWSDTGETMSLSINTPGNYKTTLEVTDNKGKSDSMNKVITVQETSGGGSGGDGGSGGQTNRPPIAKIDAPGGSIYVKAERTLDGSSSSDPDGTIASYDWTLRHSSSKDEFSGSGPKFTHQFKKTGSYTATLKVTDDNGATDTESVFISVKEAPFDRN